MPLAIAEGRFKRSYEEMKRRPLVMGLKWVEMHPLPSMSFWPVGMKTPLVFAFPTTRFGIFYIAISYFKSLGHAVV